MSNRDNSSLDKGNVIWNRKNYEAERKEKNT